MPDNKLYELLGVSRNSTDQEIKKVSERQAWDGQHLKSDHPSFVL